MNLGRLGSSGPEEILVSSSVSPNRLQESERKAEEYKAALTQAVSDLESMR